MTDVEDAYSWASYVDTYDADGALATRLWTYDDGSEELREYGV
jgi:hypothetical protein